MEIAASIWGFAAIFRQCHTSHTKEQFNQMAACNETLHQGKPGKPPIHSDLAFGVSFLEHTFALDFSQACAQVAPEPTDLGIDGYHFDALKRNFYLFIFRSNYRVDCFKDPLRRCADTAISSIFNDAPSIQSSNPLLATIRSSLADNESLIERVCIHFVFTGDPRRAKSSLVLDKLREDLESKKHLIDDYFGRPTTMIIDFRSTQPATTEITVRMRFTHSHPLRINETITLMGPHKEKMVIGFIPIEDLRSIYTGMGIRFFDRNIRSALSQEHSVNRSIRGALKQIILDEVDDPITFAFNHNGISMSAEAIQHDNGSCILTEPRLLNGVQTVISFVRFLDELDIDKLPASSRAALRKIRVLVRIITSASSEFITNVTVSNNRQNPVHPWNLHANDMIQLELEDKFKDDLGIYYERQENSFSLISDDEMNELGLTQYKPIEMIRLARTFLVSDGHLAAVGHLNEVFEDKQLYEQVFNATRLCSRSEEILLCYKIQFYLTALIKLLEENRRKPLAFAHHARVLLWALLCQALLNDPELASLSEKFGRVQGLESAFKDWLIDATKNKCRAIMTELGSQAQYASKVGEGSFHCFKTNAAYKHSMDIARVRYGWVDRHFS
jgi:hypothetical protein